MDAQALQKAARRSGKQGEDNDSDDDDHDRRGDRQLATERAIVGGAFRFPGGPPFVEANPGLTGKWGRRPLWLGHG